MKTLFRIILVASCFSVTALAGDVHSDRQIDVSRQFSSDVVGVGIVLEVVANSFVIKKTVSGGPADRDGRILKGDLVVAINQSLFPGDGYEPVEGMSLKDVVSLIRGPVGSRVGLLI